MTPTTDPDEREHEHEHEHDEHGEHEETHARPVKARVKKNLRFSAIWLIPLLVAAVVVYVAYDALTRRGEVITLTFRSADGLLPGETLLKHKNVRLGTVEDVRLSKDLSHVTVKVRVEQHSERILTDHARFWVVRPRLTAGGLAGIQTGLETLMTGAYIAVDPGLPDGHARKRFEGLEEPPGVRSDEPGRVFTLRAEKVGSLTAGAPVYYREVNAGEVLKYNVGDPRSPITISVFIRAPFDKYVTSETRFWNVSGLSVNMGPEGLHFELESLQAVLSGGIAFEAPAHGGDPAPDESVFTLFRDKASADAAAIETTIPCVSYFGTSVQGLGVGASVQLLGTSVGLVRDIHLVNDSKHPGAWLARVAFDVLPSRVAVAQGATPMTAETLRQHPPKVILDSLSLVTGQKALSLDFAAPQDAHAHAHEKPGALAPMEENAIILQGEGGGFDNVAASIGRIASRIETIPFDEIGRNLDATLRSLQATVGGEDMQNAVKELAATMGALRQLVQDTNEELEPALAKLPAIADQLQQAVANANHVFGGAGYGPGSDFQRNMQRLMRQVSEAARSVRMLAEDIDRHPESILKGRSDRGGSK